MVGCDARADVRREREHEFGTVCVFIQRKRAPPSRKIQVDSFKVQADIRTLVL
jgi:hypothetical protein